MSAIHPLTALSFLVDAGADEVLQDEPVDRFRRLEPRPASPAPSAPRLDRPVPPGPSERPGPPERLGPPARLVPSAPGLGSAGAPTDQNVAAARALAEAAPDLAALEAALAGFTGCPLSQTATRLVFADGAPGAKVMIIGEAPGRDEDLAGKPFVGRSGQLLDRMLAAIGLDRTKVYIANVVPWRPPGNRKPTPAEAQICRPFLDRQIELADPRLLLLLGGAATSALLGREEGIIRLRGRWFDLQTVKVAIPALATFHPAYLLRAPAEKRLAWRDFLALRERLDQL